MSHRSYALTLALLPAWAAALAPVSSCQKQDGQHLEGSVIQPSARSDRPQDGGDAATIAGADLPRYEPRFASRSAKLAFVTDVRGRQRVWVLDCGTGELSPASAEPGNQLAPDWDPDGKSVAYESDGDGDWDVHSVDLALGMVTGLSADLGDELRPAWSPDGTRLAFMRVTHHTTDPQTVYEILLRGVPTGTETPVAPPLNRAPPVPWYAGWHVSDRCTWSPRGTHVAVGGGGTGGYRVFDTNGRLVIDAPNAGWPSWSPDGKRIATWMYEPASGGEEWGHLEVRDVEGTGPSVCRDVISICRFGDWWWSPSGDTLVSTALAAPRSKAELATFDGRAGLAFGRVGPPVTASASYQQGWGIRHVQWSPKGDCMTYVRITTRAAARNDQGIWVADAAGAPLRRLAPLSTAFENDPMTGRRAWSADGHWIAYIDTAGHKGWEVASVDTYLINVDTGSVEDLSEKVRAQAQ